MSTRESAADLCQHEVPPHELYGGVPRVDAPLSGGGELVPVHDTDCRADGVLDHVYLHEI
jgi:hypothetical protein